jgi:O-antigen ligase
MAWMVLPPLLTFGIGLAVVSSTGSLRNLPWLAIALILVIKQPVAVPVVALLMCQEVDNGDPAGVYLTTTLGNILYYGPGSGTARTAATSSSQLVLPVVALMAAAAGIALLRLIRQRRRGERVLDPFGVAVVAVIVALVVWVAVIGRVSTGSFVTALNQEGRPFLLIGFGFAVGLILPTSSPARRSTYIGVGAAFVVLAVLVAFGIVTGTVTLDLESQNSPFYDAALPAVTAAVVLALLFHRERGGWWVRMIVMSAALLITATSLRRNVWFGMGIALLIAFIAAYGRGRAARRLGLGVLAVVPLLLAVPDVAAALGVRMYETLFSLSDSADESAQGHVSDIDLGWRYAIQAPLAGIGSRHSQLPGAAAPDASIIYLHNEWLLDWLRFGIVAAALVVALMVLLALGAVMALRAKPTATLPEIAAAMFVLILPISCATAPYLSTTNRWPTLVGIAAGVLAAGRLAARRAGHETKRPDVTTAPVSAS